MVKTHFCQLQPTISLSFSLSFSRCYFEELLQQYSKQTYQKAALVSLCSTVGAAGTGVLLDPQGLVLAAVPTPGASLPGENVSGPWLMEPKQWTI